MVIEEGKSRTPSASGHEVKDEPSHLPNFSIEHYRNTPISKLASSLTRRIVHATQSSGIEQGGVTVFIRLLAGHERHYLTGAVAFVSTPNHDALSLLGGGNTRSLQLGFNARRESVHHTPTEAVLVQASLSETPGQDSGSIGRAVANFSGARPPYFVCPDTIQTRPREVYVSQIDIAILWIASIAPPILKQTPHTRDLLNDFSAPSCSLPNPPMGKKRGQEKKGMTTNHLNEFRPGRRFEFPCVTNCEGVTIGRNIEERGSKLLFAEVIEQNVESHFALDVGSAVTYKMLVLVSKRGLHSDSSHVVVMVPGFSQAQSG
ncbi:hypothetical protein BKA70DRAFT_1402695 [Coprinopsis sp. MPI-PUGE-AT-0042]|nr:hypothetical protein BKA70DRAFT_1402695 [Coprinopsis sp. MPI-PUGE-AT-0042]